MRADERSAHDPEESVDDPAERALTRRAAVSGTVLLRNEPIDGTPVLPFDAAALSSVAVIGPNASIDRSMGGGSASLVPFGHRTLLDAITDRIGPGTSTNAAIAFEAGVRIDRLTPLAPRRQLVQPNGEPGLHIEYINGRDWAGDMVVEQTVPSSMVRFFGSTPEGVDPRGFSTRITGSFVPDSDGPHVLGIVSTGPFIIDVDGSTIIDDTHMELPRSEEFFGYGSIEATATIECIAGVPIVLNLRWATS